MPKDDVVMMELFQEVRCALRLEPKLKDLSVDDLRQSLSELCYFSVDDCAKAGAFVVEIYKKLKENNPDKEKEFDWSVGLGITDEVFNRLEGEGT